MFFCWAIAGCEYSFLLIFGFVCTFLGVEGCLECIDFGRRVRRVGYFGSLGVVMKEMHDAMKSDSSKWIVLWSAVFYFVEGECVCSGLSLGCGEALVCCVLEHCAGVFV